MKELSMEDFEFPKLSNIIKEISNTAKSAEIITLDDFNNEELEGYSYYCGDSENIYLIVDKIQKENISVTQIEDGILAGILVLIVQNI